MTIIFVFFLNLTDLNDSISDSNLSIREVSVVIVLREKIDRWINEWMDGLMN